MREWMRRNSTIWSRFDPAPPPVVIELAPPPPPPAPPPPPPTYPCATCGTELPAPAAKHLIGEAWTKAGRLDKWCDGTETA